MTQSTVNIVHAEYLGEYRLRLLFDDGKEQLIDFKPFLSRSGHPQIREFLDFEKFAAFHIEFGDLVWGEYALCFPVVDLYNNCLDHQVVERAAA